MMHECGMPVDHARGWICSKDENNYDKLGHCLEDPSISSTKISKLGSLTTLRDHPSLKIYFEMSPTRLLVDFRTSCLLFCNYFDPKTMKLDYIGSISLERSTQCKVLFEEVFQNLWNLGKNVEYSLFFESKLGFRSITIDMIFHSINMVSLFRSNIKTQCTDWTGIGHRGLRGSVIVY